MTPNHNPGTAGESQQRQQGCVHELQRNRTQMTFEGTGELWLAADRLFEDRLRSSAVLSAWNLLCHLAKWVTICIFVCIFMAYCTTTKTRKYGAGNDDIEQNLDDHGAARLRGGLAAVG